MKMRELFLDEKETHTKAQRLADVVYDLSHDNYSVVIMDEQSLTGPSVTREHSGATLGGAGSPSGCRVRRARRIHAKIAF